MLTKIKKEAIRAIEDTVAKVAPRQKRDFTYENRVLFVYSEDVRMQPGECADRVNKLWNAKENGNSIINIFKRCRLVPPEKRERIFEEAEEISRQISGYLAGMPVQTSELDALEKRIEDKSQLKRIVLIDLYRRIPNLQMGRTFAAMLKLNKDFAAECLDAVLTYIRLEFCGNEGMEEYEKEIFRLEAELKRANRLLMHLQDEFDERVEENRLEEREKLILQLNSKKYGCILDMASALRVGTKKLRRKEEELPLEINLLPALLRNIDDFVEDCGITPIMEIGEELNIKVSDAVGYQYQGSPFENDEEEKNVVVVSSGWEIKESKTIVSKPAVQEKE